MTQPITIAVPKGRVLKALAARFAQAGIEPEALLEDDRRLVRTSRDGRVRFLPLDLGIGLCKMAVAGLAGKRPAADQLRPLRVATKFVNIAARHYRGQRRQVEVIYVQGSVELAPITGLADVIVDIVETGETLRQNGLEVFEPVADISSVVIANRAAFKLAREPIRALLAALEPSA